MLMPVTLAAWLMFPALSVQVPEAVWFLPSVLSTVFAEQLAIPERASVPVKLTVTSVLFQPLELACGDLDACAVGGVLSMLIPEAEMGPTFPAMSVQVPEAD